jgi:hypothetical protein
MSGVKRILPCPTTVIVRGASEDSRAIWDSASGAAWTAVQAATAAATNPTSMSSLIDFNIFRTLLLMNLM